MRGLVNLIGRYIYEDSVIHQLNPATKILCLLILLVLNMLAKDRVDFGLLLGFLCLVIFLSRLSIVYYLSYLKPLIWLLIMIMAFHLFGSQGQVLIPYTGITLEGLVAGAILSMRLMMLVLFVASFTLTTSPSEITTALERLFSPFPFIYDLSFILMIAGRFIPLLIEEAQFIIKAQSTRGADFRKGRLIRRLKNLELLLVPLFLNSFRRAQELALALEARGFQPGKKRTSLRILRLTKKDYLCVLIMISLTTIFFNW